MAEIVRDLFKRAIRKYYNIEKRFDDRKTVKFPYARGREHKT